MAKATSTEESSLSSILANALIAAVGVKSNVSNTYVKPTVRQRVAQKYTNRIRKEASTPELWGDKAQSIKVSINSEDRVEVSAVGTPEEVYEAEMLEYGTPESPPRAVMRTYEASLNEEYKVIIGEYEL